MDIRLALAIRREQIKKLQDEIDTLEKAIVLVSDAPRGPGRPPAERAAQEEEPEDEDEESTDGESEDEGSDDEPAASPRGAWVALAMRAFADGQPHSVNDIGRFVQARGGTAPSPKALSLWLSRAVTRKGLLVRVPGRRGFYRLPQRPMGES